MSTFCDLRVSGVFPIIKTLAHLRFKVKLLQKIIIDPKNVFVIILIKGGVSFC